MDFLQIVLDGWFNSINRENLENYFLRSFKKAERDEFLDLKTFYDGCYNASQFLINEVETKNINKRINELYFMLSAAKSKTMNFDKEDETKTYEERCAEIIEYCEHELNFLNNEGGKFGFSYPLFYKGINYQCKYGEMLYLQESIIKFFMSEVEIEFLTNQKAESIPAPEQNKSENQFSVLEWATIFYYADTTKLLPCDNLIKNRLETFMNNHKVSTTYNNFKTKYYEAKRRINDKNDYPIDKLQKIIPFLEINYDQTVTKVENDIIILEENISDY